MKQVKMLMEQFLIQTKSDFADMKNEVSQFKYLRQRIAGNIKKNSHYYFFLMLMLLGLLQLYICVCATNGECLKEFLFENPVDTFSDMFMDYFNPIRSLYMDDPYTQIHAIYPPINYLLLSFFYKSIPVEDIIPDLSSDYPAMLAMRNSREAMFSYFSYCFIAILMLITVINKFLRKNDIKLLFLFDIAVLFSWGFLFTFDRGNFLLFTVAFIILFFLLEDSDSKVIRELGLLSLAAAICMKIYPVFLSLYLLTRKEYSKFCRLVVYCVFLFFGPFALYGGIGSVIEIIKNIFMESGKIGNQYPGGNISFGNSIYLIELIVGKSNGLSRLLKIAGPVVIVILGVISVFFLTKKWKIIALLTCIYLQFFPNSMTYNLLFIVIPLILFLAEKNKSGFDYIYIILFFFCMTPFPYVIYNVGENLQLNDGCNVTYGLIFACIALNVMTFFLIGGGCTL